MSRPDLDDTDVAEHASEGKAAADESEHDGKGWNRTTRVLTVGGLLVGMIAGAVGLLFTLAPSLTPCLGNNDASFTGAPVFPHSSYRAHRIRNGASRAQAAKEPNLRGAEVRFSYHTSGLRGKELAATWSLLTIERDGTLGAVVRDQDRALALTIKPQGCTETGGNDLFVETPTPRKRYRIVLELYRDSQLTDRLALTETVAFRG
jgi:hypothetical protein